MVFKDDVLAAGSNSLTTSKKYFLNYILASNTYVPSREEHVGFDPSQTHFQITSLIAYTD